jgi:hypothetical protein
MEKPSTSDVDRSAVLRQLNLVLSSSWFRNSRNSSALLRYVVERALEGDESGLKERVLGTQVFGRKTDYDSNTDPVVRTAAGEVRKRLAQFYQNSAPLPEVVISLPVGSYRPLFRSSEVVPLMAGEPSPAPGDQLTRLAPVAKPIVNAFVVRNRRRLAWAMPLAGLALLLLFAGFLVGRVLAKSHQSALHDFWSPVLQAPGTVIISAQSMSLTNGAGTSTSESIGDHPLHTQLLPLAAAGCASQTIAVLAARGKAFDFQPSERVTFYDLQRGPAIICGDASNVWVAMFSSDLRFHFVRRGPYTMAVEDRRAPPGMGWSLQMDKPYAGLTRDYAIVARILNPRTNQPMLLMAGLGEKGLMAAGRFVRQSDFFDRQMGATRSTWSGRKNIEIVLATDVVQGISGPPVVVASDSW